MEYVIIGADRRFDYLASFLRKENHRVFRCETVRDALRYTEGKQCCVLPFSASAADQGLLLENMGEGSSAVGGKLWQENDSLVQEKRILYRDLSREEAFAQKNALPTAEGCLERVIALTPFVLNGASVLIVGFGRVGSQTARLFRRCGAFVSVCVREGKSLEEARKANFPVFSPDKLPLSRPWRVIVNTVPKKQIVSAELTEGCEQLYLVIDLASGKNNADLAALARQNVLFESAGGLPGKCAPETAAWYYYQAIHQI